jgi:hypothetical protein
MHFIHKLTISQHFKVRVPDEIIKKSALYRLYTFIKELQGSRIFFFLALIKKFLKSLRYHVDVFLFLQKFDLCILFLEFFDYKDEVKIRQISIYP